MAVLQIPNKDLIPGNLYKIFNKTKKNLELLKVPNILFVTNNNGGLLTNVLIDDGNPVMILENFSEESTDTLIRVLYCDPINKNNFIGFVMLGHSFFSHAK